MAKHNSKKTEKGGDYVMASGLIHRADSLAGVFVEKYPFPSKPGATSESHGKHEKNHTAPNLINKFIQGGKK